MAQPLLGNPLEDRRRYHAAGVAAGTRRVDHHDHGEGGVREGTKPTIDTFCSVFE